MLLTKLEKVVFVSLIMLIAMGIFLLIGKIGSIRNANHQLMLKIQQIAALTDFTVIIKGDGYDAQEQISKLNLNRTDLRSIQALPQMTKPLAKKIYQFIRSNGEIKEMRDLLAIKGLTRKRLRTLENYATAIGGHSGQAAWSGKLNLNFATIEDLKTLPGVGKKMAEKIILFRNNNGGFRSIDELREVPGISERVLKKFIDKVEI